jgi:predicted transcriptional regulator
MSDYNRTRLIDKLQNLVKQIVDALIEYKRNKGKGFTSNNYQHFELKEK